MSVYRCYANNFLLKKYQVWLGLTKHDSDIHLVINDSIKSVLMRVWPVPPDFQKMLISLLPFFLTCTMTLKEFM